MTYEEILTKMLDRVPSAVDKREGSLIYDALAPAAAELAQMYIALLANTSEAYADTATREYLIRRAAERGLSPYPATKAIVKAKTTPAAEISTGQRFNLGDLNYKLTEKIDSSHYKLECETSGTSGNKSTGDLIPIEYVDGLGRFEIIELLIPGEDPEDTEIFRKRYFDSFESQAFGGNVADYKTKTNALPGVGGVKVYPVWNGGGTVKLVILTSDYDVPSAELIAAVQTAIDPTPGGKGAGLAPIGHQVTVAGVTKTAVNVATTITYTSGWSFDDAKTLIEKAIDDYFKGLSEGWADEAQVVVRISQIETRLLNLEPVLDIANTTLNGAAQNLQLGADEIPGRGTISG